MQLTAEEIGNLAYPVCALLVAAHTWQRFNTPTTNRSSTRQVLYWSSFAGYLLAVLGLFVVFCALLQSGPWGKGLLGPAFDASVPAPLMATLALTTLLPSVPLLKRLDAWLLSAFQEWGEIPIEVKRRAAAMTPQRFLVSQQDVAALRDIYGDGSYGETLADHLRASGGDGFAGSQFRFTRVVKLYDCIVRLAEEDNYARFFNEFSGEYTLLRSQTSDFLRRSSTSLRVAAHLQASETPAMYEELMRERRQAFAQACNDTFDRLALFLASAVLRSELTEAGIVKRLRRIGFVAEPISLPAFPIHSLTALAIGIFAYLALLGIFFAHVPGVGNQPGGWVNMAFKIALIRIVSLGLTVWLMQRYAYFRRVPGEPPRFFAYLLCGVLASVAALAIVTIFHLHEANLLLAIANDLTPVVLSGVLCVVLALCCDGWPDNTEAPVRLRVVEAAACGGAMVLGSGFLYFSDLAPPWTGGLLAAWFLLPAVLGVGIGGVVPHIYRTARRAASARRDVAAKPVLDDHDEAFAASG